MFCLFNNVCYPISKYQFERILNIDWFKLHVPFKEDNYPISLIREFLNLNVENWIDRILNLVWRHLSNSIFDGMISFLYKIFKDLVHLKELKDMYDHIEHCNLYPLYKLSYLLSINIFYSLLNRDLMSTGVTLTVVLEPAKVRSPWLRRSFVLFILRKVGKPYW